MSKRKIRLIAVIMLLAGIAAAGIGRYGMKGDLSELDTREIATREVRPETGFDTVYVKGSTANVDLYLSEDGTSRVKLTEDKEHQFRVRTENGTLYIEQDEDPTSLLGVMELKETCVDVYLPEQVWRSLDVSLSTGDCRMDAPLCFENAAVKTTTGDISLCADIGRISASATTGDITLKGMKPENAVLSTTTGDIRLMDLSTGGRISCKATTGSVKLTNCLAGGIALETSTGDITLTDCDAELLELTATTGDISGTLLSGKQFDARSATGDIQCPPNDGTGTCRVTTSTGDIRITVK
ncbi:MAG: DUF4097 family beta strand repeat-containing protein [Clostridia bacterium]|nr:DUF4097 family beta strand repeat-containing protein [Clostridia bacterium]